MARNRKKISAEDIFAVGGSHDTEGQKNCMENMITYWGINYLGRQKREDARKRSIPSGTARWSYHASACSLADPPPRCRTRSPTPRCTARRRCASSSQWPCRRPGRRSRIPPRTGQSDRRIRWRCQPPAVPVPWHFFIQTFFKCNTFF